MGQTKRKREADTEIQADISEIVGAITDKFGDKAVTVLQDRMLCSRVKAWIPSQCATLDWSISGGRGFPCGRISLIKGRVSSGKTTLATHLLAETQQRGGIGILLDSEYSYDPDRAQACGVDVQNLIVGQPETIEDTFDQMLQMIDTVRQMDSDRLITIVWDSVASTPPKAEAEGSVGDSTYGLPARLVSQGMRKVVKKISSSHVCLIFVNQLRKKMDARAFMPSDTMIAENPLMFHSSIVVDLSKIAEVKSGDGDPRAIRTRSKCVKNKLYPPFKEAEFEITFDRGVDREEALLSLGMKFGVVKKNGGFYKVEGIPQSFYAKNARKVLAENGLDLQSFVMGAAPKDQLGLIPGIDSEEGE